MFVNGKNLIRLKNELKSQWFEIRKDEKKPKKGWTK